MIECASGATASVRGCVWHLVAYTKKRQGAVGERCWDCVTFFRWIEQALNIAIPQA